MMGPVESLAKGVRENEYSCLAQIQYVSVCQKSHSRSYPHTITATYDLSTLGLCSVPNAFSVQETVIRYPDDGCGTTVVLLARKKSCRGVQGPCLRVYSGTAAYCFRKVSQE